MYDTNETSGEVNRRSDEHHGSLDRGRTASGLHRRRHTFQANFDELFEPPFVFAATLNVFMDDKGFVISLNTGDVAFKPNSETFAHTLSKIESAHFDRIAAKQSYIHELVLLISGHQAPSAHHGVVETVG